LPSFNIFHREESDECYDTASYAEENEEECYSESTYSSISENAARRNATMMSVNNEEMFKNLIAEKLANYQEMENFVSAFINRGKHCKTVVGYMKLTDDIREALKSSQHIFKTFVSILEEKIYNEINNIVPQMNGEETPRKQRDRECRLMIMAGEMFNMNLMRDKIFQLCLQKMFKDVGSLHQVTLFGLLIKISATKIVESKLDELCKIYLEKLKQQVDNNYHEACERNLMINEILITFKILMHQTQQLKMKCPITMFKIIMQNENFIINEDFKRNFLVSKTQMETIIEMFLHAQLIEYKPKVFTRIAFQMQFITAIDDNSVIFKQLLNHKIVLRMEKCLRDVDNDMMMAELFRWTAIVSDYYETNIININFLGLIVQNIFEKEFNCRRIVDCINILFRRIGWKIDNESKMLDNFFLYFNAIVKNENTYRSAIYKELCEMRAKEWKTIENQREIGQIEEMMMQLNDKNITFIALQINPIIIKSNNICENFLQILWKFIILNAEFTLRYAKLCCDISLHNQNFARGLIIFLRKRNETFKELSDEDFTVKLSNKLSSVMLFVGYLFFFNIASEDEMKSWMAPNFIKHLTYEKSTELSIAIGEKITECESNELKAFLSLIDFNSSENFFKTLHSVKNGLAEMNFSDK
jgi:hypothetical protein